jgi:hypothetical protein
MVFNGVITAERPVAPDYGLFSVANVKNRGQRDEHWIEGFTVETDSCGVTVSTLPLCASEADWHVAHDSSDGSRFFHVPSFGILASWECENSIGYSAVDRRATVVRQLESISEYAVEQELWSGHLSQGDTSDFAGDRYLTTATNVTSGGAVKPKLALGLVEQAFASANPGVQATIHISPLMASVIEPAFEEKNGHLVTENGSLVYINRGGDPEVGPAAGGAETSHWIYATGPVYVDLGSKELITTSASEIVDSRTNQVRYTAERPAAVYFDGCSWFGALSDATL